MASWREVFPSDQRDVYESAGFGQPMEPSVPAALLVIDVMYGFTGHRGMSRDRALRLYPNSCGPSAWEAVDHIAELGRAVRAAGWPVMYSTDRSGEKELSGVWREKHGRLGNREADDATIVDEIRPQEQDIIIEKEAPSSFFGTDLERTLRTLGIQSLFVTGTSTSGCVRATVVDAFSHGFSAFVVEDCVFDRARLSHDVSLYEMDKKYATVIGVAEAMSTIERGRARASASE